MHSIKDKVERERPLPPLFISPNDIHETDRSAIPFFFTNDQHLFLGGEHETHGQLMYDKKYYAYHVDRFGEKPNYGWPTEFALVGRVGNLKRGILFGRFVSFWNKNDLLKTLLSPCLSKLKSLELIDDSTYISSAYNARPITYIDYKKSGLSPVLNLSNLKKLDADREIHLLGGNNKKQALLQRGVTPKISPWKDLTPGQKHWAMASEGFKEWLKGEK